MSGNTARSQNMIGFQAHSHAHAITSHTVVFVRGIFGHVNMEAHTGCGTSGGTAFERSRAESKGRVEAIAGSDHTGLRLLFAFGAQRTDEALVFADATIDNGGGSRGGGGLGGGGVRSDQRPASHARTRRGAY